MSITIIFGATGAGKTAFATYKLKEKYMNDGSNILRRSRRIVETVNAKYGTNYTPPDKVPFYTNYKIKLHVGYHKYYEPYLLNGYYFGIPNEENDTEYVVPGSWLVIDEAQRVYNSRESASFKDWASYAFEIHRQAELNILLLSQRGMLIDRNIKELGVHVIEIRGIENTKDAAGNIIQTKWKCREFEDWAACERYLKNNEKTYTEKTYVNQWSIFDSFDSFAKLKDFLPPKGKDFDYLPHDEPKNLTEREKKFYKPGEPKEFRSKQKDNKPDTGQREAA